MKKSKVPFQAEEIIWNSCIAVVEAGSKEEAFAMVEKSIEENNPFADFNAEWDGINTVTDEVIETTKYGIGSDYNIEVEDVEEVNELEVMLEFDAFDLLRLEKDAIYHAVEQKLDGVEVLDMEMIPVKVFGNNVTYKCIPTKYKIEYFVRVYFIDMNGRPIEPYDEDIYTIHAQTEAEALIAARDLAYGSEKASGVGNISVETEIE